MSFSFASLVRRTLPHVAALLLMGLCAQLAIWQKHRAEEKAALLVAWEEAPTLVNPDAQMLVKAPDFTKVSLTGIFDPQRHILLDNQTRNNHPGVHIFVPFALEGQDVTYLVNRGWQPWFRYSNQWPEYDTPIEVVSITGRVSQPPRVGFRLGEASPLTQNQWPNLMTYLDLGPIRSVLGSQIADRVILLDPDDTHHLSKDPWPTVNMGPDRHLAYAFQWIAIALAIGVLWIALTYRFYRKSA